MDPIPLNAVWAAAANVAADTAGTAVVVPVADIAADAPVALAGAAANTAVVAADARASLADAAADVVAATDSSADLYRRAATSASIVASTCLALPAAFGFKTSGQGMAAVGPVRAPVELFHADETTLQFAQIEICPRSKVSFLGNIRRDESFKTRRLISCSVA